MRRSLILYLGVTGTKNLISNLRPPKGDVYRVQDAILREDSETLEPFWEATGERLRQIASEAGSRGIPVLLVAFPMETQLRHRPPFPKFVERLRQIWEPTGMPLVDLEPPYRQALAEGRNPFLPYDLHPGPLGMQIAAEAMYDAIAEQGILPPGRAGS